MKNQTPTKQGIVDWSAKNEKQIFQSNFNFINGHLGWRPQCCHGFIGTMGSGKSSVFKALIAEAAPGKKVGLWLSEEPPEAYFVGITVNGYEYLDNIVTCREKDIDPRLMQTQEDFYNLFTDWVTDNNFDIVFIDNVTTSMFYSNRVGVAGQARTAAFLPNLAVSLNIPIVWIAHTSKNVRDNMNCHIAKEDIKGAADLPIETAYLYTIQKYTNEAEVDVFVFVRKARFHQGFGGYLLLYNELKNVITGDKKASKNLINMIFEKRDRLGK